MCNLLKAMFGAYCIVLCWSVVYASIYTHLGDGTQLKKKKLVDGVEFDRVSRSTLLKMLAAMEETIGTRLEKYKLRPKYTAQFVNNQYTRPFIYPRVYNRKSNKQIDPGCWSVVGWRQLKYALWVNLTELCVGMTLGFATVLLPQIGLPEVSLKLTVEEESWIASVPFLGAPLGCIFCGCVMDRYGRKTAMLISKVPLCVGWFYTGMALDGIHMIIGRVITGIGCGMAASPPRVYVVEITLPNMRGVLSAFPSLAIAIGITVSAVLGTIMTWQLLCYLSGTLTAVLFFFDFFLPETPYFLLTQHNSLEKAEQCLRRIRGKTYDIEDEMDQMIDFKSTNKIHKLSALGTIKALFSASALKPFIIITSYIFIAQVSGVTIMILWTVKILDNSMSTVNSNLGNILMSTARFCTGILLAVLLYKVSRKAIALTSSFGVGLVCLLIYLFLIYWHERTLFPQIAYIAYVMFATLGYNNLPFMIMNEIYPLQVRGILGGITMSFSSLLTFSINKSFPYLHNLIGLKYVLLIFSVSSFLGCFFVYFYLPETKNLTLQEIEEYFNGSRATLVSQRHVMSAQLSSVHNLPGPSPTKTVVKTQKKDQDKKAPKKIA